MVLPWFPPFSSDPSSLIAPVSPGSSTLVVQPHWSGTVLSASILFSLFLEALLWQWRGAVGSARSPSGWVLTALGCVIACIAIAAAVQGAICCVQLGSNLSGSFLFNVLTTCFFTISCLSSACWFSSKGRQRRLLWPSQCAYAIALLGSCASVHASVSALQEGENQQLLLSYQACQAVAILSVLLVGNFLPHHTETQQNVPLSTLDVSSFNPMFALGMEKQLDLADLPALPQSCHSSNYRGAQAAVSEASLGSTLWRLFGRSWLFLGGLQGLTTALSFAGPLLLNRLLSFLEQPSISSTGEGSAWGGLLWLSLIVLSTAASALLSVQFSKLSLQIQTQVRAVVTSSIFRQMLLGYAAQHCRLPAGKVVNFVSVDIVNLQNAVSSLHQAWSLPVQVCFTLYLLYTQLRLAFLAGLCVLLVIIPLNFYVGGKIGSLTRVMLTARDQRLRLTGELLEGIKIVKALAWELPLLQRVGVSRAKEVAALRTRKYLDAVCVLLWASTPVLVSLATFSAVVLISGSAQQLPGSATGAGAAGGAQAGLTASAVFTTISLLNMLIFPMNAFPWIIAGCLEAWISFQRLSAFLKPSEEKRKLLEDVDVDAGRVTVPVQTDGGAAAGPLLHICGVFQHHQMETEGEGSEGKEEKGKASSTAAAAANDEDAAAVASDSQTSQLLMVTADAPVEPDAAPATEKTWTLDLASFPGSTGTLPGSACEGRGSQAAVGRPFRIELSPGELLLVLGPVGSGKSSFLLALLGEMKAACSPSSTSAPSCSISLSGAVSFAPQKPWVRRKSIRDNILAGQAEDAGRLQQVLHACALEDDLRGMSKGLDTVVSPGSLSGGQMQRLGLARALYARTDVLLLDSPLTALDHHVAEAVWELALKKQQGSGSLRGGAAGRKQLQQQQLSLLQTEGRACVLTSNSYDQLASADKLLILDGGKVAYYGCPGDMAEEQRQRLLRGAGSGAATPPSALQGAAPAQNSAAARNSSHASTAETGARADAAAVGVGLASKECAVAVPGDATGSKAPATNTEEQHQQQGEQQQEQQDGPVGEAAEEEHRAAGSLRAADIRQYMQQAGMLLSAATLLSLLFMQLTKNGSDWWLSIWSAAASSSPSSPSASSSGGFQNAAVEAMLQLLSAWSNGQFLLVLGLIALANILFTVIRSFVFAEACLQACISIHDRLLHSLVFVSQSFHDKTPFGRLLNRLSTDQYTIDESLPFQLNIFLAQAYGLLGTLLVLCYASNGLFLAALPVLGAAYYALQRRYRQTSRELKRLDSVAKSPLLNHFSECMAGASIIRARSIRSFQQREDKQLFAMNEGSEAEAGAGAGVAAAAADPGYATEAEEMLQLLEESQRASWVTSMASFWLSVRLQAIGTAVVAFVGLVAFISKAFDPAAYAGAAVAQLLRAAAYGPERVPLSQQATVAGSASSGGIAGLAGLSLSYAINLVSSLNGLIGAFSETEKEMVSIERAAEYSSMPPEGEEGREGEREGAGRAAVAGGAAAAVAALTVVAGEVTFPPLQSAKSSRGVELLSLQEPLLEHGGQEGGSISHSALTVAGAETSSVLESVFVSAAAIVPLLPCTPTLSDAQQQRWLRSLQTTAPDVILSGVTVHYPGMLRPAVQDVSLRIPAGDHWAFIGRTGSGKSTLAASLIRQVSLSAGSITIAGVDIRAVPLPVLRTAVTFVPQQALLLSGSVRWNLDPSEEHSEQELNAALQACCLQLPPQTATSVAAHLGEAAAEAAAAAAEAAEAAVGRDGHTAVRHLHLDDELGGEGGLLLSAGELQLLSLARAVLRKSKLVITDEADALMDPRTRGALLHTFRSAFAGATRITIAHRPETIATCDRVIELAEGRVADARSAE